MTIAKKEDDDSLSIHAFAVKQILESHIWKDEIADQDAENKLLNLIESRINFACN